MQSRLTNTVFPFLTVLGAQSDAYVSMLEAGYKGAQNHRSLVA